MQVLKNEDDKEEKVIVKLKPKYGMFQDVIKIFRKFRRTKQ